MPKKSYMYKKLALGLIVAGSAVAATYFSLQSQPGPKKPMLTEEKSDSPKPDLHDFLQKAALQLTYHRDFFQMTPKQVLEIAKADGGVKEAQIYNAIAAVRPLLYHQLDLINSSEELEGIIFRESSGKTNIGCNSVQACGPMQVRNDGLAEVIGVIFPLSMKAKDYYSQHSQQHSGLKERFNGYLREQFPELGAAYLERLADIADKAQKQYDSLGKRWNELRKKKKAVTLAEQKEFEELSASRYTLFLLFSSIKEGFKPSDSQANRRYHDLQSKLFSRTNFNDELSKLTEESKNWSDYLSHQHSAIRYLWEIVKEDTETNILVGDCLLAKYKYVTGGTKSGLERYQGIVNNHGASYYFGAQQVTASNQHLNRELYGDARLRCNLIGASLRCGEPSKTVRYIRLKR